MSSPIVPEADGTENLDLPPVEGTTVEFQVRASLDSSGSEASNLTVEPAVEDELMKLSGDGQAILPGGEFDPLLVRALSGGEVVPGASVTFTVPSGDALFPGGVSVVTVTADGLGVASAPVLWAGSGIGPVTVTVTSGDAEPVTFELMVAPEAAEELLKLDGDGQSTYPCQSFPQALAVRALSGGEGVPWAEITFTVSASDAAFFPGGVSVVTVASDGLGVATAPVLTAGAAIGPVTVTVTSGDAEPVTFELMVAPEAADELLKLSGDGQSVLPGEVFARALRVRGLSGGVAGAEVTFTVTPPDAAFFPGGVSVVTVTTDGLGFASAPVLTAGMATEPVTVTVTSGDAEPVMFELTVEPEVAD
ncbi:hypothetical protein [Streptomyces sp. NPDC001903]|uniref:hypothetical protein n=1 Tax=Streptomyces sp. NPDC001903 TaxID=3364622 RepID=UPI0036C9166B